jgi:hypothetical protein
MVELQLNQHTIEDIVFLGIFTNVSGSPPAIPAGQDSATDSIMSSFEDGNTNSMPLQDRGSSQARNSSTHDDDMGVGWICLESFKFGIQIGERCGRPRN